jgi:hypothetical protein
MADDKPLSVSQCACPTESQSCRTGSIALLGPGVRTTRQKLPEGTDWIPNGLAQAQYDGKRERSIVFDVPNLVAPSLTLKKNTESHVRCERLSPMYLPFDFLTRLDFIYLQIESGKVWSLSKLPVEPSLMAFFREEISQSFIPDALGDVCNLIGC